jgi:hypothetical protein
VDGQFGLYAKKSIKRWTCLDTFHPITIFTQKEELFPGEEFSLWAQMIVCECLQTFCDEIIYPFKLFSPRGKFPLISPKNQEEVVSILAEKLKVNNFTLDENRKAIYIAPSFVNHSCKPNAVYNTHNDIFYIFLIKDIEKDEEITFHYLPKSINNHDMNLTMNIRDELLHKYGFDCTCDSCLSLNNHKDYKDWIESNIKRCQNCGKPSTVKCGGCKLVFYCSEECQRTDWTDGNHPYKCNQLKVVHFNLY